MRPFGRGFSARLRQSVTRLFTNKLISPNVNDVKYRQRMRERSLRRSYDHTNDKPDRASVGDGTYTQSYSAVESSDRDRRKNEKRNKRKSASICEPQLVARMTQNKMSHKNFGCYLQKPAVQSCIPSNMLPRETSIKPFTFHQTKNDSLIVETGVEPVAIKTNLLKIDRKIKPTSMKQGDDKKTSPSVFKKSISSNLNKTSSKSAGVNETSTTISDRKSSKHKRIKQNASDQERRRNAKNKQVPNVCFNNCTQDKYSKKGDKPLSKALPVVKKLRHRSSFPAINGPQENQFILPSVHKIGAQNTIPKIKIVRSPSIISEFKQNPATKAITFEENGQLHANQAGEYSADDTFSMGGSPILNDGETICSGELICEQRLPNHSQQDHCLDYLDTKVMRQTHNSSHVKDTPTPCSQGDLIVEKNTSTDRKYLEVESPHNDMTTMNETLSFPVEKEVLKKVPKLILPPQIKGNLCPSGLHEVFVKEKSCVCMQLKQLILLQSKPVVKEWHSPDGDLDVGGKASGNKTSNTAPKLINFILKKPTRINSGGQGTVAWVEDPANHREYALKFKFRDKRSEKNWRIEQREAKILKKLKHPFAVKIYHVYETESALFMSLEYLSGGCLWNHIARVGTLPECYVTYYAACILSALQYLHQHCIVYRDMKAENICLDSLNRPKLIDFGMAKYLPSLRKKRDEGKKVKEGGRMLAGENDEVLTAKPLSEDELDALEVDDPPTRYYFAAYLAPEIYNKPASANQFIDCWGLGYIVIEMVLGYGIFLPMPWENIVGQHISSTWKLNLPVENTVNLSSACLDFLHAMLVRHPEDRMSLRSAMKHAFFARVPWKSLSYLSGPNLHRFRRNREKKNVKQQGVVNDPCIHKADPAFIDKQYVIVKKKHKQDTKKTCINVIIKKTGSTNNTKNVAKLNAQSRSETTSFDKRIKLLSKTKRDKKGINTLTQQSERVHAIRI